jgi:hypothetical protein
MIHPTYWSAPYFIKTSSTDRLGKLVSVPTESINVSERCWGSPVAEQTHESMDSFLVIVVKAGKRSVAFVFLYRRTYSQNCKWVSRMFPKRLPRIVLTIFASGRFVWG